MTLLFFSLLLLSPTLTFSLPYDNNDKLQYKRGELPSQWWHRDDHPVKQLFRRDDSQLPAVGSAAWNATYPTGLPELNIPAAWMTALNKAVADGKIPNIAIPTLPATEDGDPNYGTANSTAPDICSAYFGCRADGDIWDAPPGMLGLSFDDGPVPDAGASSTLYTFLQQNNQKATHFMIGMNILAAPTEFMTAFSTLNDDIAVHTWTHRHMSTLTNEQLIADLGWCMQIIHDSTGGRVPALWRPPYGDADNRVRAIAKEIFGLTTVIWNQDSQDWNIGAAGITLQSVEASMVTWLAGPKTPGLMILEHEITANDVTNFMTSYPLMKSNNWTIHSIPELTGSVWYKNSQDDTGAVSPMDNFIQYPPQATTAVPTAAATLTKTSSASVATATTNIPNSHVAGSSGYMITPRLWNAVIALAVTLGAFCL